MKSTTLHEYEREAGNDQSQNDYWAQTRRSVLDNWIDEVAPDSLLDVGCGSGYLADYLGVNGSFVVGIDIDQDSVALAARRSNVDSAIVGDATALPYPADTFECILLGDVVEHFENPRPILDECRRILVRDGVLVISVPAFRWLWGPHDEHNDHADRYNASRLSTVVGDAGFELDDYRYTNFFRFPHISSSSGS